MKKLMVMLFLCFSLFFENSWAGFPLVGSMSFNYVDGSGGERSDQFDSENYYNWADMITGVGGTWNLNATPVIRMPIYWSDFEPQLNWFADGVNDDDDLPLANMLQNFKTKLSHNSALKLTLTVKSASTADDPGDPYDINSNTFWAHKPNNRTTDNVDKIPNDLGTNWGAKGYSESYYDYIYHLVSTI